MKSRFFRWIRYWTSADRVATRRLGRRPLAVEMLEDRTLPAPIVWTGAVNHSLWTTPGNWDLARVPALGDDVSIGNGDSVLFNTTVEITSLALAAGSGLNVTAGTLTLDAASTLAGAVSLAGGTVNIGDDGLDVVNIANLALPGGALGGPGTLNILNSLTWNGGTMQGSGATTNSAGAMATYTSGTLTGRTLNNAGTFNFNNQMNIGASTTIHNVSGGLFDIRFDNQSFSSANPTFNNDAGATLRKSQGASTNTFNAILNNFGNVVVTNGSLNLNHNGTSAGMFQTDIGATLRFNSNATGYTLNSGTTFTGAGTAQLEGGLLTVDAGAIVTADKFSMTAGTLTGLGTFRIGAGQQFTWSGGVMSGAGVTEILGDGVPNTTAGDGTMTYTSGTLTGRALNNEGTFNFNNQMDIGPATAIRNRSGGLFDIRFDNTSFSSANPTFNNDAGATLRKSQGATANTFNAILNNFGNVVVTNGSLNLNHNGTSAGMFQTDIGATLRFNSNATGYALNSGTTFTGAGTAQLEGGLLTVAAGAIVTADKFSMTAGTLTGPGTFRVGAGQQFTWSGGVMSGAGVTEILGDGVPTATAADGTMTYTSGSLSGRALNNEGTFNFNNQMDIGPATTIRNRSGGLFDIRFNNTSFSTTNPTFINESAAVLRKSVGPNNNDFNAILINNATVDVQGGVLNLNGPAGGTSTGNFSVAGGSPIDASPNGALQVGTTVTITTTAPHNFAAGQSIQISGVAVGGYNGTFTIASVPSATTFTYSTAAGLAPSGGGVSTAMTLLFNSAYTLNTGTTITGFGTAQVTGNSLTIGAGAVVTADRFALSAGTLSGPGTFRVDTGDAFTWNGGEMGLGTIPIAAAPTGAVQSSSTVTITTMAAHGLAVGQTVVIVGVGVAGYNGTFTVTAVPGATTFTFEALTSGLVASGGGSSRSGITEIASGGTLTYASGSLLSRSLKNAGTFNFNNQMNIGPGTTIDNLPGGLFDIRFDNTSFSSNNPTINNADGATLRKSQGANTNSFNAILNNFGTVAVTNGNLSLNLRGTSSGIFQQDLGTTLRFTSPATVYTLNTGTRFTGAGTAILEGGTLTLGSGAVVTADKLSMTSGTLTGPGVFRVDSGDQFDWTGGTMSGSGATEIMSGGTFNYTSGTLSGRPINNAGTFNFNNQMNIGAPSTIHNRSGGLFDIRFANTSFSSLQPTFTNDLGARLRRSQVAGTNTFNANLDNFGLVEVTNGNLNLNSHGTSTGTFQQDAGTTLRFNSDATGFTLNAGTTFTGAGTAILESGLLTLGSGAIVTADKLSMTGGTLTGPGTFRVDSGDQFDWTGSTMSGIGPTEIMSGGTLNFTAGTLSGRPINNAGTFNFNNQMNIGAASTIHNLAGGLFDIRFANTSFSSANPAFVNDAGAILRKSLAAGNNSFNAHVNNLGAVEVETGTLTFNTTVVQHAVGSSTLTGGTWIVRAGAALVTPGANITTNQANVTLDGVGSTYAQFNNIGTNAATGVFTIKNGRNFTPSTTFANAGNVNIGAATGAASTFTLSAGGTSTGDWAIAAGSALHVALGTPYLFDNGTDITGPGVLTANNAGVANVGDAATDFVNIANVVLDDGFTLNAVGTANISGALMMGPGNSTGTLTGPGDVNVAGLITWNTGTMSGSGRTFANGDIAFNVLGGGATLNGRRLDNARTATWTNLGQGNLFFSNGAIFNNNGIFEIQNNANILNNGGAASAFNNNGTFRKVVATGVTEIRIPFNNSNTGVVDVQTGTVNFSGGGTSTGSWTVAAPAVLEFGGGTHNLNAGGVAGAGLVRFTNGTTHSAGTYNVTATQIDSAGVANFNAAASTGTLALGNAVNQAGTLGGAANFTISGLFTWFTGLMNGDGTTFANGGINLDVKSGGATLSRRLDNALMAVWTGTDVISFNNGVFNNNGTFDVQIDRTIFNVGTSSFDNNGTFKKSAGAGLLDVDVAFTNDGTVEVLTGTVSFDGTLTNLTGGTLNGGTWIVRDNASLLTPGANITENQANVTLEGVTSSFPKFNAIASNTATGSFTIQNGRIFTTSAAYSNAGSTTISAGSVFLVPAGNNYTQTAGTTTVDGSLTADAILINGGTLLGVGVLHGDVSNAGHVAPGTSPGVLVIDGDYTQTAAGVLDVEIASATMFDQLQISGAASLDGTINVTRPGGFVPVLNDAFPVLTFASRTGDFAVKNGFLLGNALAFTEQFNPTNLTLVVTQNQLSFQTQPPAMLLSGQPFEVKVLVSDSTGNPLLGNNVDQVTLTINQHAFQGGATFVTQPVVNGVATFNLTIAQGAAGYVLTAGGNGFANVLSGSFAVHVPPTITSVNNATFTVGSPASFTIETTGFPAPSLRIGSFLLPAGLSFLDNGNGAATLSGTPTGNVGGVYLFTITAHNAASPDATQNFTLTVNQAPAIISANNTSFTSGAAGSFTVQATGFPSASLSIGGFTLPAGVSFLDNGNGAATLSGTPAQGSEGVYSFTITAANGIGENATQNFTLTVNGLAIVSADHATFAEGTFGTFNVLTTGFPIPTLSDGGFVFPTGVSFLDNGDGTATLSGTPATGTAGNYQFTITAQNGVNPNATQSFTLTITPPVLAPQITSANSAIFIVGSSSSFNITTTGLPTPSLNIGGFILPAGLTFTDPGNGTASLAGTPTGNVGGTYNFTITAQNGIAPDATQSFTLTINQAAAITSANNTTFTVGTAGSFTATTTGFPTASLNIGDFVLPPGLSFVNLGNGAATLSGAPAANTGGVYTFDIAAQNGVGNAAAQSFTLTINQAAAITSANNATFTVGTAGSFTVTTTGFPKPTLDIGGFQLPNGLACLDKGDGTATLSGTPTGNVGGIYTFTITAQNGIAPDATQPFTLTINQAPAITSANNTTFTVGTAGSLIVTTTGFPTPSLNIGDFVLPPGLTFVNLGNGAATLSGAPAANSGGVYTFDIAARNGVGSAATQPFTLTINQAAAITSANTATFIVGTPGSFIVTTTGFPKPSLDIGGFQLPNGLAFLDNADGTATLSGTPTGNVGGIYTFTITAQNGIAPDATRPFTLTINLAPAITSANNTTFTVGTAGSFTVTTTGFPTPSLNIGDFVLPPGLSFVNLGNGAATLSGVPAANTGGVYTFDIAAQNGVGSAAVQSFTLTINQAAAITSANNATFTVGTAGSFTVTTTGFPKPSLDIGGFVLTNGVNFLDNGDGTATLSGTPSGNVGGIYTFTITAQNGIGDAATQPFTLTVNQVAAITSANSAIFTVETLGSFTVSTTGFPKPSLNIGGFILPPGLAFTDNFDGTATLSGMPTGNVGGIYHFTITAQNGIGTNATQDFTLTVHQAAAITSANIVAFTVATPGSFTITTTGFPKPTIDIGAFIMPMGLFFSDLGDGTATLIGTPAPNVGGTYTFTIAATNGIASAATQNFTLTVNQAPAITSADNATFTVGVSGSFTVTATGFPTPTLSKGAFVLPNGLTFTNNGNGAATLAGPPVGNVGGTYHFDITAQNGIGADALQAFTLTINQAPTITLNPVNKTVLSSQSVTFTAAANGFPVPNVQWQRSSDGGVNFSDLAADADYSGVNSTDLTIAAALGAMTGHRFRAVFTNAAGNATTTAAILTVVSKPSIILQPANKITTAGLAVTFSAAAAAVPAATVRWQISLNGGATYVNLVNTTAFTGVFTNTLRILRPSMAHNGARFRAVYTNIHGSETTTAAILTVNPPLSVVPATLPIVKRFVPISLTIRATGGTGVRHITYKLSKLLPSGLTISPVSPTTGDITISGKTAVAFNVTITITVTDDLGAKKIVNLVLRTSLLPTRRGF